MKIATISDLHIQDDQLYNDVLDQWSNTIKQWQEINKADICIIPGDCFEGNQFSGNFFKILEDVFGQIIYVPGNHEYWKDDLLNPVSNYKHGATSKTTFVDETKIIDVQSYKILCGTMWYDAYSCSSISNHRVRFNDFSETKNYSLSNIQNINDQFISFAETSSYDIVVTHHAPRQNMKWNDLDGFYFTNCENIMDVKKPKLWIHGHQHVKWNYMYNETRIICNAQGYFNPFKNQFELIEIK
jgi:predicted phosphohydrolase